MALSKAEKTAYNEHIKHIKVELDETQKKLRDLALKRKKVPNLDSYYGIEMVMNHFEVIIQHIKMNDISLEMLQIKNESYLNEARKEFYKLIQVLEEILGSDIERTLSDNDKYLSKISSITPDILLEIVNRLIDIFNKIISSLGENSKWKWSFVELYGRIAVINQNIISFTDIQKNRDPRKPYYKERQALLYICKDSLNEAAKQYRQKYELSTHVPGDLLKCIEFLSALRKIHVLFGEVDEAQKLQTTIDASKARLTAEEKKEDSTKKIIKKK